MKRVISSGWLWTVGAVGLFCAGCQSGGVGDPCTPEDEYHADFSGFQDTEVNVESRSFQCETRVCLVNHFRGRVSCPYGQTADDITQVPTDAASNQRCTLPGTKDLVTVPVDPQYKARQAEDAVYCSCRCNGPDKNARYCECPEGYQCTQLVEAISGLGGGQLAGSYCVRKGTKFDPVKAHADGDCVLDAANVCGPTNHP
jgi:hypothetical protein